MSTLRDFERDSRFISHVAVPVGLAAFAIVAIVAALLVWSTAQSDRLSAERQQRLVELVFGQSTDKVAYDQESATVWDESVENVRAADRDLEWLDGNLGIWMHDYFGIDRVYILDPGDRPIYEMRDGARGDPAGFARTADAVLPFAAALRNRMAAPDAAGDEGKFQSPGIADFALVEGRPAIVSVKPIVTDTGRIEQEPGSEFVHVAIRFLDGSFVRSIGEQYMFQGARVTREPQADPQDLVHPLVSRGGEPVAHFIWHPYRPGSQVFGLVAPAFLAALFVAAGIVALLVRRLRQRSRELESSEARALHLASHDALTGLPNRALFYERLDRALIDLRRTGRPVALLYLDLDRFKQVNDTLGHPAGDELIRELGRRISGIVRSNDTVARLGGDEFAIIQADAPDAGEAEALCSRIIEMVRQPFELFGARAYVGISIGVARAPVNGTDRDDLTRKADIALYQAKATGRCRYVIFGDEMDATIQHRRKLEEELRVALAEGDQLQVCYQPLYSARDGSIRAVEALVRWHHPRLGILQPESFVPIAEEAGLSESLGDWLLWEACRTASRWPIETLTANISITQLRNPEFPRRVARILARAGFPAHRLELEIPEASLLRDPEQNEATIKALRDLGVRIALDHFGTGYSSLALLRRFDISRVKIDRKFVDGIAKSASGPALIQAIVDLAQATGMKTTAEGVETVEQQTFLTGIGCDTLQGLLLSRPVASAALEELFEGEAPLGADDTRKKKRGPSRPDTASPGTRPKPA